MIVLKFGKVNLNFVQAIAIIISLIATMWTGGTYFYNWYQQPYMQYGQHFESAWFEYGIAENTLHVIYVPDGVCHRLFLAVHEAVHRVEDKALINPGIDSKPLKIELYVWNGTEKYHTGSMVVSGKILDGAHRYTHEERIKNMQLLLTYTHLYAVPETGFNCTIIHEDGSVGFEDGKVFNEIWFKPGGLIYAYSNETLQNKIDELYD